MVGDNLEADVQGAQAVGIRAVLVRGQHREVAAIPANVHRCPGKFTLSFRRKSEPTAR